MLEGVIYILKAAQGKWKHTSAKENKEFHILKE